MKLGRAPWFMILMIGLLMMAFSVFAQDAQPTSSAAVDTENGDIIIDAEATAESFVNLTDRAATGFSNLFGNFIDQLYNAPQSQVVQILMVLGGVVLLLAGWRIYNWIILIAGILIGASMAMAVVGDANTILMLSAMLIGAVVGAIVAYFGYYVAVFFIGAYVGIILTGAIATSLGMTPISIWVLFTAAILGGFILIGLSFELLVLLASVVGAQLIVIALALQPQSIWIIGLTLLGVILQSYATRRLGYAIRRRPARRPLIRA